MGFLKRRFRRVTGILGTIVLLIILAVLWVYFFRPHYLALIMPPGLPEKNDINQVVWLDQNWSDQERYWYHHASQGTATIPMPYDWFLSLEAPEISLFSNPPLLHDPDYLARIGFISSPSGWDRDSYGYRRQELESKEGSYNEQYKTSNPDGLPVGFAKLEHYKIDEETGEKEKQDRLGFTCAACHTGHFTYQGVNVRIDGAPAMTDLGKFRSAMSVSLVLTAKLPGRLERFAKRLAKRQNSQIDINDEKKFQAFKDRLEKDIDKAFKKVATSKKLAHEIETERCKKSSSETCKDVNEGFGRLDAINRIGNQVFYSDLVNQDEPTPAIKENLAALNAPVSFPHIWSTPWFLWAQYDGSIQQPLIRNVGEALGVSAYVNLRQPHGQGDSKVLHDKPLYSSSIDLKELNHMEEQLQGPSPFMGFDPAFKGLQAPKWPTEIFSDDYKWKIDVAKANKGKYLYDELCAECHMPPVSSPEFWESDRWVSLGQGKKFLNQREIKISEVGTDPARAKVLYERAVNTPDDLQVSAYEFLHKECGVAPELLEQLKIMPNDQQRTLFALALMIVTEKTTDAKIEELGKNKEDVYGVRKNCPNENLLKALLAGGDDGVEMLRYRTRPLNGIWATAPYLHNGSVPDLYSLLSPQAERPEKFCVGNLEFDPVKVGYVTGLDESNGKLVCDEKKLSHALDFRKKTFEFDTSQFANLNVGHVFDDVKGDAKGVIGRKLSEEERWDLVEYLKTL